MEIGDRLLKLLESNKDFRICNEILKLKRKKGYINGVNYLDIAIETPSKISYVSEDRDCRFDKKSIASNTEVVLKKKYGGRVLTVSPCVVFANCIYTALNRGFEVSDYQIYGYNKIVNSRANKIKWFFDNELRLKHAYMTSPIKMLNKLGIMYSQEEAQSFMKMFYRDSMLLSIEGLRFEVVNGDDIRKYYDHRTYFNQGGSLGSSCKMQPYIEICK